MPNEESLWNIDLFLAGDNEETPKRILSQQAALVEKLSSGVLYGTMTTKKGLYRDLCHELTIHAPALSGYSKVVVSIEHDMVMYPSVIFNKISGSGGIVCDSAGEVKSALRDVFSSPEVGRFITSMVVQSKE